MKILQLGKFYPIRGGVEKVMYDMMLGLSARQIHCDMLCASTEDYPAGDIVFNPYAKVMVMHTQIKLAATMLAPSLIFKLKKIAKDYDIIHIHHPDPMACLALFLSGYKGKVVLQWHSDILKQKNLLKLYKPLQDWLIKRAHIVVGTTPVYVEDSPFLKKVKNKLDYIPIGVEAIKADPIRLETIQERYQDRFLIFSLGRLVEYKGYEYLIKAASYLTDDYKIIIGGKGPLHDELKQLIKELGVENKVELLGFVDDDDAYAYFQASHVFALSSIMKTEAFAIVQIEAMSCSKPIVTAHIPESGVSWVNKDNTSGIIVEKENAKALADAFVALRENPDKYERLSNGASERFKNNFCRDVMIDKTIAIYSSLIENNGYKN